jgi:hypothetical protein
MPLAAGLTKASGMVGRGTGGTVPSCDVLHTELIVFRVPLEPSCAQPVKVAEGAPERMALRGEK